VREIIAKKSNSPEPREKRWFGTALPTENQTGSTRAILERASRDASRIIPHDPQVIGLMADYLRFFSFDEGDEFPDDTDRQTSILHEIDLLVERIVVDSLRRRGWKHIKIEASCVPQAGILHCNILLYHKRKEARRHIEVIPQ
jgi:hypothetical protein